MYLEKTVVWVVIFRWRPEWKFFAARKQIAAVYAFARWGILKFKWIEEIHLAKAKFSFCSLLWILWIVWINILFRILHVSYENYSSRILQEGGMGCGWNLKNLLLMTWTKLLELVPKFQHSFMVQTFASLDFSLYITLL